MKRFLSVCLVLTLLVTPALASQAMGWDLVRSESVVGPGTTVTTQRFWGDSRSDYRVEQYVTYTPGQGVYPQVVYGATVPEKATLSAMAKSLESGGKRVLAGANGDYFVVATGVPLGMVVTGGVLRSSAADHYAVGFDSDGKAMIGYPQLSLWADFRGGHYAVVGGYNKTRTGNGGLTLFSRDFGTATKGTGKGMNVILRPVDIPEGSAAPVYQPPVPAEGMDEKAAAALLAEYEAAYRAELATWGANLASVPAQLRIGGGKLNCVVIAASSQTGPVAIPEGCFILTAHQDSGQYFQDELAALRVGEQVTLSVTAPDERWNGAVQAIGGFQMLLKNGVVQEGLDNTANPRTALGIKADGRVILYTMDGRRSGHSVGASMRQIAARLKELGCVDAVLFDGGGSTTFGATGPLDSAFSLQNKPSDGSQRAVSTALFFVSGHKPTGELGSLYLTPQSGLLLPGGTVRLSAQGIDSGGYPMGAAVDNVTYTVTGDGTALGSTFTAGRPAARSEVTVTGTAPDGQSGCTILTVVPTPHTIALTNEATGQTVSSLNLDPGQTVALTAAATWYGLPMTANDGSFTWSVTPAVGTVDAAGTLTAGSKAGSGSLSVTAGEKTVSIPVTVAGHVNLLEPWEEGSTLPTVDPEGLLRAELTGTQVRYGRSSLKVEYLTGGTEARVLPLELPLAAGESDVGFWVYPTEEVTLALWVTLTDGSEAAVPCAVGAPGRWSFVRADLPAGTAKVTGLTITPAPYDPGYVPSDVIIPGGVAWATLYLDHITSTNGGILDETPPTVKLTCDENGAVKGTIGDNVDKTFAQERVSLTLDGKPLAFQLTGNTVTAQVELYDALLHRISLTVSDASGNLARASVELPPAVGNVSPFSDVDGHWGRNYADYLYDQGISKGSPGPNGTLRFDPAANITRGDFVTMLMRWMGTDLSRYEGVALPFADAQTIQPWAVDAVKAAYALGIFTGSGAGDALYANANDSITRAQAMALLSRAQPKGFAPSGESFLDKDAIPAWAAEHIAILVGQGAVSGYGGYVRPNDPITRAEAAKVLATLW